MSQRVSKAVTILAWLPRLPAHASDQTRSALGAARPAVGGLFCTQPQDSVPSPRRVAKPLSEVRDPSPPPFAAASKEESSGSHRSF
ncbi:hypothetical protein HYQ46_012713 [Verticillium longisporum]|nr:hypothetical protein HYQ46_012713 [Verticillium longisporum]